MAKNLKLTIKNTQIAEAINLGSLKKKLAKKKEAAESPLEQEETAPKAAASKTLKSEAEDLSKMPKEEQPRIKARSKSAFAEGSHVESKTRVDHLEGGEEELEAKTGEEEKAKHKPARQKTSEELRKEIFEEPLETATEGSEGVKSEDHIFKRPEAKEDAVAAFEKMFREKSPEREPVQAEAPIIPEAPPAPKEPPVFHKDKLGPTGRHIKDLLPPKPQPPVKKEQAEKPRAATTDKSAAGEKKPDKAEEEREKGRAKLKGAATETISEEEASKKGPKAAKVKEFRDVKPSKRVEGSRTFDARDRHGLRDAEEDQIWRKKRAGKIKLIQEESVIRPTQLKIRIPIIIKDLASEMKLKASQLIAKLFLQGMVVTLNDILDDETAVQLLGQEFGCEITIDTTEEKRIRISDQTAREEIKSTDQSILHIRPPVVAFMGHVDHGKTTLIDFIRKSNRAAGEAGAITQHIGAFRCSTPVGDIAILDTPGHEAFSAMRARGADVTDIVVLVVAGDEGIRQQTVEAIQHAKAAGVTIVVAINKSDKPNFNPENVYRQLADQDLLPESWGGQTITVNCSALTGAGIKELLEMLALQAEVLELKANPSARARGRVLESEMHKGMGAVATVLVQNGTLKLGDSLVFDQYWGRVKTMQDEYGRLLEEASPSTPVEITGLSGLPEAGQEFIVVKNEREAREIAEVRMQGAKQNLQAKKKMSVENLFQQASEGSTKKIMNVILRADVQGSVEALKVALMKIESDKVELNIIFTGVGEVSESDIQLAAASKAVVIGFHTAIESHADAFVKQLGVQVRMHDIIYHAIDDVKLLMSGLLDKIAQETDKGKVLIKALFKSSQYGTIAGCQVTEGSVLRSNHIRVVRNGEVIAKSPISSLKRVKEDVREVQKGLECGIVLSNFSAFEEGDILEAYEITYITQEL